MIGRYMEMLAQHVEEIVMTGAGTMWKVPDVGEQTTWE